MPNKNHQKLIAYLLGSRQVAFNPILGEIAGSALAGLLLSQLLYWDSKRPQNDKWFYKTIKELQQETCLTRYEQETAIKKLKSLKLLEVKLQGVPARRFFRVSLGETYKLVCGKVTNWSVEKQQTITEITTEITTEKEKINKRKVDGIVDNYRDEFFRKHLVG